MLPEFRVNGETVDSLDLKVLILTKGMFVRDEVYRALGGTWRISRDPLECSALFLPDNTVIHVADIGPTAPFQLALGPEGKPCLVHGDDFITAVSLPAKTDFYKQRTSRGVPFHGMAVLQGHDVLSFPYLWPCELAKAGLACKFCHYGNFTQRQSMEGTHQEVVVTPQDVADVVDYAVNVEKCAKYVQITGGSTVNANAECDRVVEILRVVDEVAGLPNIRGETIVYTTPPSDPGEVDKLFSAGADRVACDMEIWDEGVAGRICPGKSKITGRGRHLDTLLHIAGKYGPNKACSAFVVGLEPAESFLSGAEYLASHGVVPVPSIWMPHGLPVPGTPAPPDLDYYRRVKRGLAEIYHKYQCEPPGDTGFNVCLCRDTWNHRSELVQIG
jgi:hypothetical protein